MVLGLIETDDPAALMKLGLSRGEPGYREMHPVMESEKALSILRMRGGLTPLPGDYPA